MQPLFNSYINKLVAVVLALKEKPIQHLNFIQCREKKHKEKKKKNDWICLFKYVWTLQMIYVQLNGLLCTLLTSSCIHIQIDCDFQLFIHDSLLFVTFNIHECTIINPTISKQNFFMFFFLNAIKVKSNII